MTMRTLRSITVLVCGLAAIPSWAEARDALPTGSGVTSFTLEESQREIEVYSHVPDGADLETPTVFILTGLNRNAEDYRDAWIDAADRYGFNIVVPYFSEQDYPGVEGYNLGNMTAEGGRVLNSVEAWSFGVIDELFDEMQSAGQTERESYYLFGHSAGCQFVHRMLTFVPQSRVRASICSAAGWWTLPDTDNDWPYGLKGAPVDADSDSLRELFGLDLLVTVGDEDNDPWHHLLRRSHQAMAQGDDRVERAWVYYKTAEQQARRHDLDFNWSFQTVPGVGHDNAGIASFAAEQFDAFERDGAFDVVTP